MEEVQTLFNLAGKMGIELSDETLKGFSIYKSMIIDWNQKMNLTAITDPTDMDIKHFADSLSPIVTGKLGGRKKLIDIGTGAGFPGVPLKLWNNDLEVTLMDSLNKRITFLDEVIAALGLENIHAVHGRAEELALKPDYREKYDVCISRAVASLDVLSEYCIPFVKQGGYFIAMKGPSAGEEVRLAEKAIEILGGKIEDIREVTLPDTELKHVLVLIKKEKSTPAKYPRGGGKPRSSPLK